MQAAFKASNSLLQLIGFLTVFSARIPCNAKDVLTLRIMMNTQVPLLRMSSTVLAMTVLATAFSTTKALPPLIAPPNLGPHIDQSFSSTDTSTVTANSNGIITLEGGTVTLDAISGGQIAALLATGANAQITATGVTIVNDNLQGTSFTFGVNATSTPTGAAAVNLFGGSIDATAIGNGRAVGINAGVGGTVRASNLTLDSTGPNAHAIVSAGGTIALVDGAITTNGSFALGLQANGNAGPATITVDGTTIRTLGPTSSGARAEGTNAATISLTNATIDTEGDNATGLIAIGTGKTITTTNTNIETVGSSASGAADFNGAHINETGGTMTTSGSNSIGISSNGLGSTLTAVGLTVTTTGTDSSGALAHEGALLTLQNSIVTTTGDNAVGLKVIPAPTQGSTLMATNSTVSTNGLNGEGILVSGRVPLTVTDVVSLNSTNVTTQQGDGIDWDGQSNTNVSLTNGTTVVPGNGVLLRALAGTGGGTPRVLNLTADGTVALEGDVLVGPDSVVNVNLLSNSVLTGAMQNANNVAIETGSRWDITGSSTIGSLTFNGGTLQFNNAVNLGITRLITLNASGGTINTNGNDATLSQAIVGVGGLTKTGAGTLTLSGTNTYSGGTSFNGGILAVNSDSNLGTGPLSFNGGTLEALGDITSTKAVMLNAGDGTFLADAGTTSRLSGAISGVGGFTKDGAGELILTGVNSYSGSTVVKGGTLNIQDGGKDSDSTGVVGTLGTATEATGTVNVIGPDSTWTNSGRLLVGAGNGFHGFLNIQNGGTVSDNAGSVGATPGSTGTVTVDGAGSMWTSAGGLFVGDFGTGTLNIHNGGHVTNSRGEIGVFAGSAGTVAVDGTDSTWTNTGNLYIGGIVAGPRGTGLLEITNGGTVSAAATTIWNTGTLAVGASFRLITSLTVNGGTIRTLADTTFPNNATLVGGGVILDSNGFDSAFSGAFTGSGGLTKISPGLVILTGDNTFSGGTTILGGTLELGNDGTTGSISGNVTNNGTLEFDRRDPVTFSGVISGSGDLVKIGAGTLTLTANNTYSGGTTIQDGTLVAGTPNAAQEVSFALGAGDVFLQGGTLRTSSLETGKPLTINVGGNYTQGPGGTLALGVAGINGEDYDHVQVGGNASLNGTLAVSSLNNFRPSTGNGFEVLHTNGVRSGQFSQVNDSLNNNSNLQRIDVYAPNGVALVYVAAAPTPPTPSPTPRPPIIDVIPEPLPPVNPEEPLPIPPLLAILDPTAEQLTSLFEISFSGANSQRFNLEDRLAEIQRGSTGFESTIPPAASPSGKETIFQKDGKGVVSQPPVFQPTPENRWGVWVNGWGDFVSVDSDNRAKGYDFTTGGATVGIDYRFTDHLAIGLFGSYAHTWTHLQPAGDIDVNTGRGGLYATYFDRGFYVNGSASGGYNSYDTSRQGLLALATGSTEGYEFSTFLESGYDFHFGNLAVGPLASVQYTNVHVNGFSEQGSLLPLRIHSDSEESWRTDLGLQASYTWHCGSMLVVPSVRAAWEHEFKYSALPITVSSAAFPGATATFFGPSQGHDSAIINAGLGVQWTPRISTYVGYQGQLGRSNYEANGVTGNISFSF